MIGTFLLLVFAHPQEPLSGARAWDPVPSSEQTVILIDSESGEELQDVEIWATDLWPGSRYLMAGYWGLHYSNFLRARAWRRVSDSDGKVALPITWKAMAGSTETRLGVRGFPRHRFDPPLSMQLYPTVSTYIRVRDESGRSVSDVAVGAADRDWSIPLHLSRTDQSGLAKVTFSPSWFDLENCRIQLLLPTASTTSISIEDPLHPPKQVELTLPLGPRLEIRFEPPPDAEPPFLNQLRMNYQSGEVSGSIRLGSMSGVFHLPLVDPGTRLNITVEDLEQRYWGFVTTLVPRQTSDVFLVEVPMQWYNFVFEGQLLDPEGSPLANQYCSLDLHTTEYGMESECELVTFQSDELGRFRFITDDLIDSYQGLSIICASSPGRFLRADFLDLHAPRPEYHDFGMVTLMPAY